MNNNKRNISNGMRKFLFCASVFVGTLGIYSVAYAQQAILYFAPATGSFSQGQTFWVQVMVDTKGQEVNAAAVYFDYPQDLLEAVGLDTTGSIIDTFTPEKSAAGGKVAFAGGKTPPAFLGIHKLFSVGFRAKSSAGGATLAFSADSAVVTSAESKNILSVPASGKGVYTFRAPVVPPPLPLPPTPTPTPPPAGGPTPQPSPQPTPPVAPGAVISDIRAEELPDGSVLISWKTNEKTRSSISYGPESQEEYAFSILDEALETEHSFALSDVRLSENYSLEISAVDELGNQTKTDRLMLAELFEEEGGPRPPGVVDNTIEIGGFEIRPSMLFLFAGLPLLVLLLAAFLLFQRMRSRIEG